MGKLKIQLTPEEHAARKAAKRAAWVAQGPAIVERPYRAAQRVLADKVVGKAEGAQRLLRVAVGVEHLVKGGDGMAAKRLLRDATQLKSRNKTLEDLKKEIQK